MNNMEPIAYCLGGSYGGIVSDNFSFLDMDPESLKAKGDGGLRQLHNYDKRLDICISYIILQYPKMINMNL